MAKPFSRRRVMRLGAYAGAVGTAGAVPLSYQQPTGDQRSVRDFGAKGDGVSDDTKAFQQTVDAGPGGIVIPHGTYCLDQTIKVDLDRVGPSSISGNGTATLLMKGKGPTIRFNGTHGGTASPATVNPNIWERQRSPMVDGIEIVGQNEDAVGIQAVGTMQMTLSRLVIRKTKHALHFTKRNRNVLLTACHLYENRGIGLFLDNVDLHQINVTGSHISYNAAGGIVLLGGAVRNLQVSGCDIESNMSADNPPSANILFDTTGGSLAEAAIVGCTIQHNHDSPGSANIRVIGAGGLKTRGQAPGNITIADNVLSDVFTNVHLQDARGITIVGNTFWKGYAESLRTERSSHICIGPNTFDRNPAYQPGVPPNHLVFETCSDCQITGIDVNNTRTSEAALIMRQCRRMNVVGCSFLDNDNCGVLLDNVTHCRVSDCLIRDDRATVTNSLALRLTKGQGNMIVNNMLGGGSDIANGSARVSGNYDGS